MNAHAHQCTHVQKQIIKIMPTLLDNHYKHSHLLHKTTMLTNVVWNMEKISTTFYIKLHKNSAAIERKNVHTRCMTS